MDDVTERREINVCVMCGYWCVNYIRKGENGKTASKRGRGKHI